MSEPGIDRKNAARARFEDYMVFWAFLWGHQAVLSFEVVEIYGEEVAPKPQLLFSYWKGGTLDGTPDPAQAATFLRGSIKWDGCSNLRFDGQDETMLHFCGADHAAGVGRLLQRMYEIAAETIPRWDADLGGIAKPLAAQPIAPP